MNDKIYIHGITSQNYKQYNSLYLRKVLKQILKSDAILSTKLQKKPSTQGFNGSNYISLCDYEKRFLYPEEHEDYNSYELYIRYSIGLVFPKEVLEVITPTIIDRISYDKYGYQKMTELGESTKERYSDMPDEVQVKDKIPLELLSCITLPIHSMDNPIYSESFSINKVIYEINKIKQLTKQYEYDVPIYDIDTFENLNNKRNVKKLIRKNRGY